MYKGPLIYIQSKIKESIQFNYNKNVIPAMFQRASSPKFDNPLHQKKLVGHIKLISKKS